MRGIIFVRDVFACPTFKKPSYYLIDQGNYIEYILLIFCIIMCLYWTSIFFFTVFAFKITARVWHFRMLFVKLIFKMLFSIFLWYILMMWLVEIYRLFGLLTLYCPDAAAADIVTNDGYHNWTKALWLLCT